MASKTKFFFSNRVELLFECFKTRLFQGASPFSRRILIVPSPAMKTWLTVRLADDPEINIAAGIEYCNLEEGIERMRRLTAAVPSQKNLPTSMELTLKIEVEIRRVIKSGGKESPLWKPLLRYLRITEEGGLSRLGEKRLASLAEKLAHLFKQYGRYGGAMLQEWKGKEWQALLWGRLFDETHWTYPYDLYSKFSGIEGADLHVHLFAISSLSALQHRFFHEASQCFSVSHYLLSPCALFWSDIRSDKESAGIMRSWRNRGASEAQQEQLEELLRDRNALLANFGRLGREMAQEIEESSAIAEECYLIDESAALLPSHNQHLYDDLRIDRSGRKLSLLSLLQADMALLRNPENDEKVNLDSEGSIQVHVASHRMREIEILYDTLLGLIDLHAADEHPIRPSDIIVLAPDISAYEPFIKAVFGGCESKLNCQIMDLAAPSQSRFIKSFLHLLAFPSSQWDAKMVYGLLESGAFQRKQKLGAEEVETIKQWIKESGILWGESSDHRDELLRRDHCTQGMFDKSAIGTWDHGLGVLITSLAYAEDQSEMLTAAPRINASQSDLLGKLMQLLRSLRQDLHPLNDGTLFTVEEWASYLESLLEAYFSADSAEADEEALLRKHLQNLRHAAFCVKGERFPFSAIERRFIAALMKEEICYRESHVQTVKFCSMLPMRAVPARIVALIGMDEGAYPKLDFSSSLNAMRRCEEADYCPSQVDYDRFLFLEILLSARDYCLISYSTQAEAEAKETPPSLLVTELMSYLDSYYTIDGKAPSEHCCYRHPYASYDASYFSEGSRMRSYSRQRYRAALSFYHGENQLSKPFIEQYFLSEAPGEGEELLVDLKQLSSAINNPLRLYFNKTLGIYLKNDEEREIKVEESFALSHLDRFTIGQEALKAPLERVLDAAEKGGKLPMGLFKEVAIQKLQAKTLEAKRLLNEAGIDELDFFDIEMAERFQEAKVSEGNWTLPPLHVEVDGRSVYLIGKIANATPQGIVAYAQDKVEKLLKFWAEYVVLCCLVDQYGLPIKKQLIPICADKLAVKSGLPDDPRVLIQDLLRLYLISLKNASPLSPEWLPAIMRADAAGLKKAMAPDLDDPFNPIHNEYFKWIVRRTAAPEAEPLIRQWKPIADRALSYPFNVWYPSKAKKEGALS